MRRVVLRSERRKAVEEGVPVGEFMIGRQVNLYAPDVVSRLVLDFDPGNVRTVDSNEVGM